jgi:DNA-directed RNA polymerase specialized sigma subunit
MFEGLLEAFEEKNAQIEKAYEEKERAYEEKELLAQTLAEKEEVLAEKENLIIGSVKKMYSDGQSAQNIAKWLNLPLERVIEITQSLGQS